jgi:hypothetical protein
MPSSVVVTFVIGAMPPLVETVVGWAWPHITVMLASCALKVVIQGAVEPLLLGITLFKVLGVQPPKSP